MALKAVKAYSYTDIEKRVFKTIKLSEEFQQHLGEPQLGNSHWLVFGKSGDGKTSYLLQVVKELCANGHQVHYNTLEEGIKRSFQLALKRENMKSVTGFSFQQEKAIEYKARLSRTRQKKIQVVDSVKYFFRGMRTQAYFDFIAAHQDTTFIWVSGQEGKLPNSEIGKEIYYDADIVVNVKDFVATIEKNRFEAYQPRIIWHHGANERQLKLLQKG